MAANNAKIYFIHMLIKNLTSCEFLLIGLINLKNVINNEENYDSESEEENLLGE